MTSTPSDKPAPGSAPLGAVDPEPPPSTQAVTRTVHFARAYRPGETPPQVSHAAGVWSALTSYVWSGVFVLIWVLVSAVGSRIGLSKGVSLAISCALGLGAAAAYVVHLFRTYRPSKSDPPEGLDAHLDPRARVRCIVPDAIFMRLRQRGPVLDHPFEPRIFAGFFAVTPTRGTIITFVILMTAGVVGAFIFGLAHPATSVMMPGMQLPIASGIASIVLFLARPTYLRVVPGRIDVLHYTVLTRRAVRTESVDLRAARVTVDFPRKHVIINPVGAIPALDGSTSFWFGWMPRSGEFVHTVLQAAICSAPTPELPPDELVG